MICSIIGPCEQCFQCLRDDPALCEEAPFFTGTMLDGTTRLSQGGTPIHTLHYQGSYAEFAIVPERFVVPRARPTRHSMWCAGWRADSRTGLGAAMVRAEVTPGSSVRGGRRGRCRPVHDDGRALPRRDHGRRRRPAGDEDREGAGARARDPRRRRVDRRDPVAAVLEVTGGRGADYGFDAAGVPGTLDLVLAATRPGATCVVIGRALGAVEVTVDTTALLRQRDPHRHLRRVDPPAPAPARAGRPLHGGAASTSAPSSTGVTRSTSAPQALDDLHHGRVTRGVIVVDPPCESGSWEQPGEAAMSGGSISFDEIESREGFLATGEKPTEIDWLPDPPRQPRHVTLISVDDHLVEPPDMFEGRVPAKFADAAPRVMTADGGATEYWLYDGQQHFKVGLNAVVGKPLHQRTFDPARFDEMRRGA